MNWLSYFQTPLYLLGIPIALSALLFIYKRKGIAIKVKVATTLLLKALTKENQARSKFKPPWRIIIEILVIILLILAASNLKLPIGQKSYAIIIDNSFHTFARHGSKTRLDQIKEEVKNISGSIGLDSKLNIYEAYPEPKLLSSSSLLASSIDSALNQIKSAYSENNILSVTENILANEHYDYTYIVSDLYEDNFNLPNNIKFKSVSSKLNTLNNNIAISAITKSANNQIDVSVSSYSELNTKTVVVLNCFGSDLNEKRISEKDLDLLRGQSKRIIFSINNEFKACKAKLQFAQNSANFSSDLIAEDNLAWIINDVDNDKNLIVSNLNTNELKISNLKLYNFERISSAQYEELKDLSSYQKIIFHKYYPEKLVPKNQLIITPPSSDKIFNGKLNQKLIIENWSTNSKLLTYLKPEMFKVNNYISFNPKISLSPIISTSSGQVISIGLIDGNRFILSGLELLPYEGEENTLSSILLLNSLKWLSNINRNDKELKVYDRPNNDIKYIDSNSLHKNTNIDYLREPGLVLSKNELYAINFINSNESNLNNNKVFKSELIIDQEKTNNKNSLFYYLIYSALLIIIIDTLWLYFKRAIS
jgi:hypothetical protein